MKQTRRENHFQMSSLSTHWEPGLDLEHQFPRAREGLGYKAVPMASIIDRQGAMASRH